MIERMRMRAPEAGAAIPGRKRAHGKEEGGALNPLRAVAAQLLLATGAGATLEQVNHSREAFANGRKVPVALTWAPLLLGPLAAAANIEHARHPTDRSAAALRFLSMAAIGIGGCTFLVDAALTRERPPRRLGPIAFASAGLLGLLIERQESEITHHEEQLRRRARVVERFVPRRRARLDRIVVHV